MQRALEVYVHLWNITELRCMYSKHIDGFRRSNRDGRVENLEMVVGELVETGYQAHHDYGSERLDGCTKLKININGFNGFRFIVCFPAGCGNKRSCRSQQRLRFGPD